MLSIIYTSNKKKKSGSFSCQNMIITIFLTDLILKESFSESEDHCKKQDNPSLPAFSSMVATSHLYKVARKNKGCLHKFEFQTNKE